MIGRVIWFSDEKGYGFIRREAGGGDVFVHFSAIEGKGHRGLAEGETVEFTIVNGPKGQQAQEVRRVAGPVVP